MDCCPCAYMCLPYRVSPPSSNPILREPKTYKTKRATNEQKKPTKTYKNLQKPTPQRPVPHASKMSSFDPCFYGSHVFKFPHLSGPVYIGRWRSVAPTQGWAKVPRSNLLKGVLAQSRWRPNMERRFRVACKESTSRWALGQL